MSLPLADFDAGHPSWPEIHMMLGGGEAATMFRRPYASYGGCYWVSTDIAAQLGGEMVPGWRVEWVPGLYVQATHHGVVKAPDGWLDPNDVSANTRRIGRTLFVEDRSQSIDLRWPVLIENRFFGLIKDPDISVLSKQYSRVLAAERMERDGKSKIPGASWSPFQGWKGVDGNYHHFLAATERADAEPRRLAAVRRLKARYFPHLV